ncbi:Zinc finger CCCH domain-containing protein 7B [Phytophthora pseudosyringae]|uniref:Zinc finger CCCH domain-containing protein 7B n=1 Tax=Phytophthora pseudosyringae TaxID=221518 RepID=A0A8T1WN26_9STRA|nr:Zinc finger CCCH domain-containing protein 7B [Phytophthora pseudosyringae]
MSDVQSLSDSPASSVGLGSSLMWEKVALSPLELLSVQLDHELQHAEEAAAAFAAGKQNKNGVDVDAKTGKTAGRMTVEVLAAAGLTLDKNAAVQAVSANAQPELYVSTQVTPLSAFEKTAKKHLRTSGVKAVGNATASWKEPLVFEGAKTKHFGMKVSMSCSAEVIADVVLGELELRSADYEDQVPHEKWFDLKEPTSAATTGVTGKLLLRVTFEHSARERHERQVALLLQKKRDIDEDIEKYKTTARLVNAPVRHPAAFGKETARAALYLPGNRFHIEKHNPAAVSVAPLADKTRIVTPFGRGVVVSFRPETKMYVVQMDTDAASKNHTIAYLRQKVVKEEPDEPHLHMHMKVETPYGLGVLEEIRPHDDVLIVKTGYARMFMQRRDVKLPAKELSEMSTKDLINEAIKLADAGNEEFREGKLQDSVYSYLRSLGFLHRVDQDNATHKEKATIIQTMIRCHLNIGACKLKLNAYADAEIACTNALSILTVLAENREGNVVMWMGRLGMSEQLIFEDWPSKARFRRAQACVKLEKYVDAKQDLLLAVKLNPRDKSCRTLLDKVSKLVDKQKRDEKKAWGGIFDNLEASPSTIKSATKTTTTAIGSSSEEKSIFTRKTRKQHQQTAVNAATTADEAEPWYLTTRALATASVVTAGVAAVALLALKPKSS